MDWSPNIEALLDKIRLNSSYLSDRRRTNFYRYKNQSKFFDIPIIIVSVFSASFSVGSQAYLNQSIVSSVSCGISMFVTILSSIKLYLNLDDLMKSEFELSKAFNILSLDIFKVLHLEKEHREVEPLIYLNEKFTEYKKLIEASNLLIKKLAHDELEEDVKTPFEITATDI